jgi:hypothetical protein
MVSSTDHVTPVTGLSPTVVISKNGGAFASPSGAVSEIGNGWYAIAGNASDRDTLGELLIHATGTGADPVDDRYMIVAYDPFDSVRLGLTALPNAAADAAGGLPISDEGGLDLDTQLATLTNGTYGLSAIETLVDDLESRLTATRAGYLDQLEHIHDDTNNAYNNTQTLVSRLSSDRAGYLDNLSGGAVALASVCTEARLAELASANIPADIDTLISRLTALRAGYLDKLNITGDVAGATPLATMQGNVTDILADTAEIQTELADGGRTDLILDAILSDTNELQTDWHDGGRLDLLLDTAQNVGTIKVWNGTGWE